MCIYPSLTPPKCAGELPDDSKVIVDAGVTGLTFKVRRLSFFLPSFPMLLLLLGCGAAMLGSQAGQRRIRVAGRALTDWQRYHPTGSHGAYKGNKCD